MTAAELWDKFADCAGRGLPRENIAPLFARLECLDEVADIREVMRLLEQPDEKQGIRFAEAERAGVPLEATWVP